MCSTEGCKNKVYALGMCNSCYQHCRYWHEKSLKERVEYSRKMFIRQNNIRKLSSNVRTIRSKSA